MVRIQRHRGPDDQQVTAFPGAVLGHARLVILDPGDSASQPMVSTDGAHVLVFNGEIYNYKELRRELRAHHSFKSDGDTEVLLAAWRAWGEGCLDRLNGMFAFCVYDTQNREAFFARDRFGQKPLYYHQDHGRLLVSSEIKGLIAAGVVPRPNRAAWLRYLSMASYDDNEETFFNGVNQICPGECARWRPGKGLAVQRWYHLRARIDSLRISNDEAAEEIRELMLDLGRVHMRADVPVGLSLSGGFDSSALLSCISGAGKLTEDIKCFSVEFGGAGELSERKWISAAARHHGLGVDIDEYTPQDLRDDFVPALWHAEAPLGGLMNCGRQHVMEMAQSSGVKVIQDGTGLDEAFAGYKIHHDVYLGELLRENSLKSAQALNEYMHYWRCDEEEARKSAFIALNTVQGRSIDGTRMARPELLNADIQHELDHIAPPCLEDPTGDSIKDSLLDYILIRKIPRNNRFTDRMSMACSVELRFPFLDHRFVEFGLRLPNDFYFQGGLSKSIVREAMKGLMDEDVRTAPKRSVHTPQGSWLRTEPMRAYIESIVESDRFSDRGFFDIDRVREIYGQFCRGAFDNSFFVWQWINVEEWFRLFIDGSYTDYALSDLASGTYPV